MLSILSQACASLEEAHGRSIIHRDIKPDNIFVLPTPRPDFVKVLDFSVAKLVQDRALRTQAGIVFGTPEYMAPEIARGQTQNPRSWKSYQAVAQDIADSLERLGSKSVRLMPDDMMLGERLRQQAAGPWQKVEVNGRQYYLVPVAEIDGPAGAANRKPKIITPAAGPPK